MTVFRDKLIESAKKREWCYLGYADFELPTWNDIFFNIENTRHGGSSKWRRDPNLNFQMYDTRNISSIKNIQKFLQNILKNNIDKHSLFYETLELLQHQDSYVSGCIFYPALLLGYENVRR